MKKEEGNLRRIEEMTSCDNIEPRPFTSRDERDIIPLTLECLIDSPPLRALINLSIFFHPGHSYSTPLAPYSPPIIGESYQTQQIF